MHMQLGKQYNCALTAPMTSLCTSSITQKLAKICTILATTIEKVIIASLHNV